MSQQRTRLRALAGAVVLTLGVTLAACTPAGGTSDTDDPITIGASLPLTGPVADRSGPGFKGYELWAEQVNDAGGLLGRPVELNILDDGFDQDQAVSNYTKLISQDKVDLLLGTFSSFLNLPASAVAERNGMLYVEPSGGASDIFEQGFTRLFFVGPGTTETLPDNFLAWAGDQSDLPATAAYVTQTDPNTEPAIQLIQDALEDLGVETVYDESYPAEQTTFDSVADAINRSGAGILIHGAVAEDGASLIQALQRVGYNPDVLFQTNSATDTVNFPTAIGEANTEGIFTVVAWTPSANFPGSAEFVSAYQDKYGEAPTDDSVVSFAAAQILQAAVEAVGEIDQDALAEWLHANSVETILGDISWDDRGVPQGALSLAQWQDGKLAVVSPAEVADSDSIVYPKPAWVG
jgi:branched-chain amino acid transport system substrate-binding protein